MSDSQDGSSVLRHPLLDDLVAENATQEALLAELAAALGGASEATEPATSAGLAGLPGELLVHRRTLPVLTTQFAASLPAWSAGLRAERVVGPIRDRLGRETWFDLFRRVQQLRFVRSAGAAPFLALPVVQLGPVRLGPPPITSVELGRGSLWLATKLLAAAAADGVYTGLRIAGGTLRFGQPVAVLGDEVVVPAGVTCDLELELEPPPAPGGTGAGQDVRDASFRPPRKVAVHISGASATVAVQDKPGLRLYGQEVTFAPSGGPATYLPQFNRVTVPLAADRAQFTVGPVRSVGLRPDGAAPIAGAAWALPAARIAAADLGEASGVGALLLDLAPGLSATWTGQADPVPLGATVLLLDEARLSTVSAAAHGYAVAQYPALPAALGHGRLGLAWAGAFPLAFFAQAVGTEAVITTATFEASLETPVDVDGERIALRAANALLAFIENAAGLFLWAQAELPPPAGRGLAFGLTNAVLRASDPTAFTLVATYDGSTAGQGALAIGYDLIGLIPSLPDPYAANIQGGRQRERSGGRLFSLVRWTPAAATLAFLLPPTARPPTTMLTDEATERPQRSGATAQAQPAGALAFVAAPPKSFDPASEAGPASRALGDALDFERQPRLILLDVSTNVSQFGVALRPARGERDLAASQGGPVQPLAVEGLDLGSVTELTGGPAEG